nr:immunoglobulin light chain junction region [Macaca mulatta]
DYYCSLHMGSGILLF